MPSNTTKIALAIVAAGVIIAIAIYFTNRQKAPTIEPSPIPTAVTQELGTIPSPSPSPASTPSPSVSDETAIKMALAQKLGVDVSTLDFSVNQKADKVAKGNVKEKTSEVGGGYWLAAKTDSGWVIVYDGQSTPTCSQIELYDFPTSMIPECLNSSGNVVQR